MGGDGPASPGGSADDVDDGEAALEHGPDGDTVPARHRRSTRELVIGGGAIAVLLVLVGVGVLSIVRQSDDQSYVGTDDDTMPLLGWRNGTYEASGFRAGWEYAGTWLPPGVEDRERGVTLVVAQAGSVHDVKGRSEPTIVAGMPARLVHGPSEDDPDIPGFLVVEWEPKPGWYAAMSVGYGPSLSGPLSSDEKLDLLTRAAKAVRPIGPEAFGAAVDQGTGGQAAPRALVFPVDEDRSIMRFTSPGLTIIALEPLPNGHRITELCISDVNPQRRLDGPAVTVRGTEGMVVDVPAPTSPPTTGLPPDIGPNGLRTIAWSEGDVSYRLAVDGSVSTDDAVAIADAMFTPDAEEWGQLFVVAEPPRHGSDIYC
jgi:hypothetical protein